MSKLVKFFVLFILVNLLICMSSIFAEELKPTKVVIESSYQEKNLRPLPPEHEFDLQYPGSSHEPYFPELITSYYPLPEDFPHNIFFSGWTLFSGGLAELFLGDRGTLENAVLLYEKGDHKSSYKKLLTLLHSEQDIKEEASLWLAWLRYKKAEYNESFNLLKSVFQSRTPDTKIEAYYLASLILIKQRNFQHHYLVMQQFKNEVALPEWGFRLRLAYFISLVELGFLAEADQFLLASDLTNSKHVKLFYLIEEISGHLNYGQGQNQKSLNNYLTARTFNPQLSYQRKQNRNVAWLYYFNQQYNKSLQIMRLGPKAFPVEYAGEIQYLQLSCLVKLQQWKEVINIIRQVDQNSTYFTYSAFQIRSNLKDINRFPELSKIIAAHDYSEPNMKFYASLLEGNNAFIEKNYARAEQNYLKAMSVDVKSSDYLITQYNLGLSYLLQKQFDKAIGLFAPLLKDHRMLLPVEISYHLLFALYQANQDQNFLETLKRVNIAPLNTGVQNNISLMKGGVFATGGKYKAASAEFLQLWERSSWPLALEFGIKTLYAQRQFDEIINLVNSNTHLDSEILFYYYIKAHLGKKEVLTAYRLVKDRQFKDDKLVHLRIEVLLAAQKFQELIDEVKPLVSGESNSGKRLFYYLSLGNAHFNLKRYLESKQQFYKALKLANSNQIRSLILYNIALTTFQDSNYLLFEKEITSILKRGDLTNEIRYSLVQMLVDYYWKIKQPHKADQILKNYADKFEYQKSNSLTKRIRLLYQAEQYGKCFQLAKNEYEQQIGYNQRDRAIMAGYCGNKTENATEAVLLVQKELDNNSSNYRIDKLNFVLAQGYFNLGQYSKSYHLTDKLLERPLKLSVKHETQLLMSRNAMYTDRYQEAVEILGNLNQYRQTNKYEKSLEAKAILALHESNINIAVRTYLRLFYLPKTTDRKRQELLMRICEVYYKKKNNNEASIYLSKISIDTISQDGKLLKRYQKLREQILAN